MMTAGRARFQATISGEVQMVGYRAFASRQARALRVDGYVRNLPDGRVEVAAEGTKVVLEDFLEELRRGPAGARVEEVAVSWQEATGEFRGFRVAF